VLCDTFGALPRVQMHSMLAFEFAGGWSDFKGSIAVTVLQFLLGGGGSFSSGGPGAEPACPGAHSTRTDLPHAAGIGHLQDAVSLTRSHELNISTIRLRICDGRRVPGGHSAASVRSMVQMIPTVSSVVSCFNRFSLEAALGAVVVCAEEGPPRPIHRC